MPRVQGKETSANVPCMPSFPLSGLLRPRYRAFRALRVSAGLFLIFSLLSLFCLFSLLSFLFGGFTLFLLVGTLSLFILRRLWWGLRRLWR